MALAVDKGNQVWARVRTSHGTGTVVEVEGEKYLVDLDGQAAQLWEKAWGLKKAQNRVLHDSKGSAGNATYPLRYKHLFSYA